jgi:hypothetical protein
MHDGSEHELARLEAHGRARVDSELREGNYDGACRLLGLHTANVSSAGGNCYFEVKPCHGASRGAAWAAGRVGAPTAAEGLRFGAHRSLLAARRTTADAAEAALLGDLLQVRA